MARKGGSAADAWRERFERFGKARTSVVRFCKEEDVSTASFYKWRKRLGEEESGRSEKKRTGNFRQVFLKAETAVVIVTLPGGCRMEIPAGSEGALRVVVGELLRTREGERC